MTNPIFEKFLATEEETLNFGWTLAKSIDKNSCIIYLQGGLGAGKTTLTRGFLRGFGYEGHVKSPTYTLVEPYDVNEKNVFHFDLYRLADPEELLYMGFQDYFNKDAICLIEWPEAGGDFVPNADLEIEIQTENEGRLIKMQAKTEFGKTVFRYFHETG